MKWKKFTLETTTEAVDYLGSLFEDLGIEGMEIEDHVPLTEKETKGMFIDILPELPPDDGTARVSFYLDEDADTEEILNGVREGLKELRAFVEVGAGTITASETEDKDWINNWKQYFKPFTVDHILIKPTWEEIPKEHEDKLLIQIDPGTAFGTGKHETTQLCIRQLVHYVKPGMKVLDLGTGSGILGITALKLDTLLVARAGLGTINHTVLTVSYLRARGIGIKGIILNHFEEGNVMHADNLCMIEELTGVPVLATVAGNASALSERPALRELFTA